MIRELIARFIMLAVFLAAALWSGVRVCYQALARLTVGSSCSCARATVDVMDSEGRTARVVGCIAAVRAVERAQEAWNKANAAYMHSSRVKSTVERGGEPRSVKEIFDRQELAPTEEPTTAQELTGLRQAHTNGRLQPGQPTR